MRSLWPRLASWLDSGKPFALATVSAVSGSTPRVPGACMAIDPDGPRFLGSVSSGCLEMEVIDTAREVLRTGGVKRMRFGPDGQPPWSDGLTCGGWLEIRVEPWWAFHPRESARGIAPFVRRWLESDTGGVVVSSDSNHLALDETGAIVAGDATGFDATALALARESLRTKTAPSEDTSSRDPVFIRTIPMRPRLFIVGAVDLAVHLVPFARETGFATIVVDPRTVFATADRFPNPPDQLISSWPQKPIAEAALGSRDAALVVTHDPKIDDVALLALLETSAGYIGALGSTRSHASRLDRLREQGAREESLARIHGPAGIHLGTPDAAGIAVGILAGILQWQAANERHLTTCTKQPDETG